MHRLALAALLSVSLSGAALAYTVPPPPGALPLSQVLASFEAATPDLAWIDSVDWDDDGFWDLDYVNEAGRKREVRLDPLTGAPRR